MEGGASPPESALDKKLRKEAPMEEKNEIEVEGA